MAKVKSEFRGTLYGRDMQVILKIKVTPHKYDRQLESEPINEDQIIRSFGLMWKNHDRFSDNGMLSSLLKNMKEDTDAS